MMTPAHLALLTGGLVALAATAALPAEAQSTRYPRAPVDVEAEAEARSDFWEEAVRPGARRYEQIVTAATDTLRQRSIDEARVIESLREATTLRPELVEAWGYLGVAAERDFAWKACAEAYGKAFAIDPRWRPTRLAARSDRDATVRARAMRPLELGWAMCLSRAGELATAAHALEALVARGEATGETWLRLGEVYMAEGRLAEAITALDQARSEPAFSTLARWLLAVAYDRARRPADADAAAAEARDVSHPTRDGAPPFVPPADIHYVRAFAARNAPEQALALYRAYLAEAPVSSPWRARAQEHLDALAGLDLAARVAIQGTGDRAAVERAVRPAMPALRACMASAPTAMVELRITQLGPAGKRRPAPRPAPLRPPIARTRPGIIRGGITIHRPVIDLELGRRPPEAQTPGVHASTVILEVGRKTLPRDLLDCVEKVGMGLTLPRPAPDTFLTVLIPVVADG